MSFDTMTAEQRAELTAVLTADDVIDAIVECLDDQLQVRPFALADKETGEEEPVPFTGTVACHCDGGTPRPHAHDAARGSHPVGETVLLDPRAAGHALIVTEVLGNTLWLSDGTQIIYEFEVILPGDPEHEGYVESIVRDVHAAQRAGWRP